MSDCLDRCRNICECKLCRQCTLCRSHIQHSLSALYSTRLTFCLNRCIVTEGGTDKNQPGHKPMRTIEIEFVQGTFVLDFCTRPTKNRGGPRCVTYFPGVLGCVTKCDRGGGSKLTKNSVTYFMDA